jgi:hypothetical protein
VQTILGVLTIVSTKSSKKLLQLDKNLALKQIWKTLCRELLESHSKDLTNDDLLAIDHEHAYEEDEKETEEKEVAPKEISSKNLQNYSLQLKKLKKS